MRVAYVVLVLSLIPTAVVYYRVRATVASRGRARFERLVEVEREAVSDRISHYVDEMMGVRGLFAASPEITPKQWSEYLNSLEIQTFYPGIRTLGYLERVSGEEKGAFLAHSATHADVPDHISPEGQRPIYFPEVFLKHFDSRPAGQLGRDHFAYPDREQVLEQARDSGLPEVTGRVPLLEEGTSQQLEGFVIYLPVYRSGALTATVEERRASLQGFVFANFQSALLMTAIFGGRTNAVVNCEVFDGTIPSEDHLLYRDESFLREANERPATFVETVTLPMLNRSWTIRFRSLPVFESESEQNLPAIALICWLTLSFLLFGITYAEVNAHARAQRITAELRDSEAALAAEKERLAVTLYSIGDGVITTDTKGCVLSLNKVAEELTGWPQAETLGKPLADFFKIVDENSREPIPSPLEEALNSGRICSLEQAAILVARDGTERAVADSAAPIRDRDGRIVGAVVVFRDVTEKQKSEAELLKESKLESVGLLAGGIAHDFNNILQGILGNLSLARMNAHSTERMLERLAGVEKSAMRAKELTQQLVMFARGGAPIRKRVQLSALIKDATLFSLQGSNVNCEFVLPTDIWPVDVDEGQFRQVINNIVLNAMQAMPEGGKIEVRAENVEFTSGFLPPLTAGKYLKISIRDTGTGIKPEHLPRIFDPYFTTRKHARGLGLASAYSVVRKHDGQISVETQVARGSTFQIYLPASLKPVETLVPGSEQKQLFGHGRVLVMDDEVVILELVREMLELMGYEVEVAKDGQEAVNRYMASQRGKQPFSAVIMDLTIPEGMGGKEAIRRLREFDPGVKAIVSSGYSYDPVMANFREYGFSGVIPKPYVMEELGRVLGEVIANEIPQPRK